MLPTADKRPGPAYSCRIGSHRRVRPDFYEHLAEVDIAIPPEILNFLHALHPKKESLAKASRKTMHSKTKKPAHKQNVGIFTAYAPGAKRGAGKAHITADETDLKESSSCVVANDRLRFGTRIIIEGIGTCEVHDRIGKRARANRFDIFMNANLICAKDFGRRRLKFTIARG